MVLTEVLPFIHNEIVCTNGTRVLSVIHGVNRTFIELLEVHWLGLVCPEKVLVLAPEL